MPDRGTTNASAELRQLPNDGAEVIANLGQGMPLTVVAPADNDYLGVHLDVVPPLTGFIRKERIALFVIEPPAAPRLVPAPAGQPPVAPPQVTQPPVVSPLGLQAGMKARTTGHPNFHNKPDLLQTTVIRSIGPNLPLELTGNRTGAADNLYWPVRLIQSNEVGFIHEDLVVPEPPIGGGGGGPVDILLGSPFNGRATLTQSPASHPPHHVVYGGNASCDLDIDEDSRGKPVHFRLSASDGNPVRGVVFFKKTACKDNQLENGGMRVDIRIELQDGGSWHDTGRAVTFAHMDPLQVDVGSIVTDGDILGVLGPQTPAGFSLAQAVANCGNSCSNDDATLLQEYHSGCAQHSHTHVEPHGCDRIASNDNGKYDFGQEIAAFQL